MKLFGLLLLLALASFGQASYSSAWKVEKLNEMLKSQGPVLTYDAKAFDKFIEGPRNFSTIIVFTALTGAQNCQACRTLDPEYVIAASSWATLNHPSRVYFARLDYASGSEIFARLKLNTAPVMYHFPPNEGDLAKPEHKKNPMKYDKYDIQRNGDSAEDILKYVETIVHTSIPMIKAPEYLKFLLAVAFLFVGAAAMKLLTTSFAVYLRNPLLWAFGSMLFTLTMTSGNMWNLIRGAPYSGRDEIINPSFGNQYVLETRIVATLCGTGALALLGLVSHIPVIQKPSTRRYLIYVYCGMFFMSVSLFFLVFRMKNTGYPFRLFF